MRKVDVCSSQGDKQREVEPHTFYTAKLDMATGKNQDWFIRHPLYLLSSWKDWKAMNSGCAASLAAGIPGELKG